MVRGFELGIRGSGLRLGFKVRDSAMGFTVEIQDKGSGS